MFYKNSSCQVISLVVNLAETTPGLSAICGGNTDNMSGLNIEVIVQWSKTGGEISVIHCELFHCCQKTELKFGSRQDKKPTYINWVYKTNSAICLQRHGEIVSI